MLRRIGIGMCIIVCSNLFEFIIYFAFVEQNDPNGKNAAFVNRENELPINEWLMLLSYLVKNTGFFTAWSIAMDFFMAQTPCQMRGLISTVIIGACGIIRVLYVVLDQIRIQWVFYIARCVAALMFFIIFLLVSKWYKLRKRDDVIPYHMFAEDQFESDYRQEREWLKDHGYFESSVSKSERQ